MMLSIIMISRKRTVLSFFLVQTQTFIEELHAQGINEYSQLDFQEKFEFERKNSDFPEDLNNLFGLTIFKHSGVICIVSQAKLFILGLYVDGVSLIYTFFVFCRN